jgi:hypothetical protein
MLSDNDDNLLGKYVVVNHSNEVLDSFTSSSFIDKNSVLPTFALDANMEVTIIITKSKMVVSLQEQSLAYYLTISLRNILITTSCYE